MKLLYCHNPDGKLLASSGASAARNSRFSCDVENGVESVVYFEGEFDPSEYEAKGVKCTSMARPGTEQPKKATRKKATRK